MHAMIELKNATSKLAYEEWGSAGNVKEIRREFKLVLRLKSGTDHGRIIACEIGADLKK